MPIPLKNRTPLLVDAFRVMRNHATHYNRDKTKHPARHVVTINLIVFPSTRPDTIIAKADPLLCPKCQKEMKIVLLPLTHFSRVLNALEARLKLDLT